MLLALGGFCFFLVNIAIETCLGTSSCYPFNSIPFHFEHYLVIIPRMNF